MDNYSCYKYIIGEIVKNIENATYLELGVYFGDSFDYIRPLVKRAIGVDRKDQRINRVGEFYVMKTDDYFKKHKTMVDVVFIDAGHKINNVIKDFKNSLCVLNKYGIIFIHDTDPKTKKYVDSKFCDDSYKIVDYIIENYPSLNVITLPLANEGLTLIMRKSDRRVLDFITN